MSASANASLPIDLTIADPLLLLNEIAKRYESAARILMEYVDNPLDDAETIFRANGNRYPTEVVISIHIDSLRSEVTITDNCRGMMSETLRRIVQNIGQSQKKGLTWVNGRFGFGVHAFRGRRNAFVFAPNTKATRASTCSSTSGNRPASAHRRRFPPDCRLATRPEPW